MSIKIRPVEISDSVWIAPLRNDVTVLYQLNHAVFYSVDECARWIESIQTSHSSKRIVVQLEEKEFPCIWMTNIGLIRMDEIDYINGNCCIGLDIVKEYRGKGYAKTIYNIILDYCFNVLRLNKVWLEVLDTNKVAISLYQSIGFKVVGSKREHIFRDGRYHDLIVMDLLKSEWAN